MELRLVDLTTEQTEEIEEKLEAYDLSHIGFQQPGHVRLGLMAEGRLVAGADACMTAYHILYVSTVFVEEAFRGQGLGRRLMEALEARALALGANLIRLDTFDWQGEVFYEKLGYERVGRYACEADGFSETFFLKRLPSR